MKLEPINNEMWYVLVAPDGSIQTPTLAPDKIVCIAMINTMHKFGVGESLRDLEASGFTIQSVIVNITEARHSISAN